MVCVCFGVKVGSENIVYVIKKVFFDVQIGDEKFSRIVIGLFGKIVLKMVENFYSFVMYEVRLDYYKRQFE